MKLSSYINAKNKYLLFSCFILFAQILFAQQFPEQNNPPKIVNDFAGVLNTTASLEADLVTYNNTTSNQIAVVTINSTDGYDISDYAIGLFNNWHIGQAKKNNGVLILVAVNDRKTFIVTGQGVEEFLPDLVCKKIVDNDMIPEFKNGNYDQGISNAIVSIKGYLDGTFKVEDTDSVSSKIKNISLVDGILIFMFIVGILILILIFSNGDITGGTTYRGRGYTDNNSWGGGWSGGSSWGGGSSSGGGGFGGFGGGSSGGGGAGGSW